MCYFFHIFVHLHRPNGGSLFLEEDVNRINLEVTILIISNQDIRGSFQVIASRRSSSDAILKHINVVTKEDGIKSVIFFKLKSNSEQIHF